MLLDMVMLSSGMRESFRQLLMSRGFEIRLSPKGTLPFDTDASIPGVTAVSATLASNPDIETISPVMGASIHIPVGDRTVASTTLGIDPLVQGDYGLLAGVDVISADAIVANDELLRQIGATIGDTLNVATRSEERRVG